METPNKKQIGWGIVVMVMVAASLFFGVKFPLPPEPVAVPPGAQSAVADRYYESLIVDKELTVNGTMTVAGTQTLTGPLAGANPLVLEGATADAYETTLAVTDPTADRTITFPNSSGTVALNPYGESIEFEGATADAFETTLAVTDPTADQTITLPNESGVPILSAAVPSGASSWFHSTNSYIWEGTTADEFEAILTVPADPAADYTYAFPAASGTTMLSTLATNAPDAANSVTGASNGLVLEGATANDYETTITPTDPTADRTVTLQDASGTVALTSQGVDMTLTADATGGNAGAKNEFIGLPRIKLIGGGQGTNPGSQTIALADDSPEGEFAAVDASVVLAAEAATYRVGAGSLKATWAADSAENDGFVDAGLFANASLEDQESVGMWLYTNTALASGDLQIVLTDDGAARKFAIPAVTANSWQWVEVDISSLDAGTGDVISDFAVTMTAQGAAAATLDAGFITYFDTGWAWDSVDEEALGVAIQQDGVLGVINTESGAQLVDGTDYFTHYQSGNDAIVYITDQSTADIAVLVAY